MTKKEINGVTHILVKNIYGRNLFYRGTGPILPNEEFYVDPRLWLVKHWLSLNVVEEVSGEKKTKKKKKKEPKVEPEPVEEMAEPEPTKIEGEE